MKDPICGFEGFCTANLLDNIKMDRWADNFAFLYSHDHNAHNVTE